MKSDILLYTKTGCPWCVAATQYLNEHGFCYQEIDVLKSQQAFEEMRRISGQNLAPTLKVGDKVLPNFGPNELAEFLQRHQITPKTFLP